MDILALSKACEQILDIPSVAGPVHKDHVDRMDQEDLSSSDQNYFLVDVPGIEGDHNRDNHSSQEVEGVEAMDGEQMKTGGHEVLLVVEDPEFQDYPCYEYFWSDLNGKANTDLVTVEILTAFLQKEEHRCGKGYPSGPYHTDQDVQDAEGRAVHLMSVPVVVEEVGEELD